MLCSYRLHNSFQNSISYFAHSLLVIFFLLITLMDPILAAEARSAQPALLNPFSRYGFEVEGFSQEEEQIILTTLERYAQALGGPEILRDIMVTYGQGQNRGIRYNPDRVGANSTMELSPTVFSLEKSRAANYSTYGTVDEAVHAQVVIGHEIGHLLIWATEERTGVDWSADYARRVQRDWTKVHPTAPMEEAVTNLSLKVSQVDHFWALNSRAAESNPRAAAEIDAWTVDFLSALQQIE